MLTCHAVRLLSVAALILYTTAATAQSVEDFYKAKRLTLIIASGVGGGYDAYGRTLARHFGRHLPGNPIVIVQNMDGASGLEATNHIANRAERDGSVFLATYNSLLIQPLFDNNNILFDALTLNWIGSVAKSTAFCFTWHTSSARSLEQAMVREVTMGSTGATGNNTIFPKLLNQLTGTKFKPIPGYTSNGVYLALEQGEVEGICGTGYAAVNATKPQWLSEKKLNILTQFGIGKSADMPDVPLARDFVKNPADRKIFDLLAYPQEMGRPFVAPPNVPQDRLQALRRAFDATMKDPEFLAESKKAFQDVEPLTGEEVTRLLKDAYATPQDVIVRYKELIR